MEQKLKLEINSRDIQKIQPTRNLKLEILFINESYRGRKYVLIITILEELNFSTGICGVLYCNQ